MDEDKDFFEWDPFKEGDNIEKHGVDFDTAKLVFKDPRLIILRDIKHSRQEERFLGVGRINARIMTVRFVYRGEKIRPEPINYDRIMKNKKIEIINNTNIIEIKGKQFVEKVILDKPYKGSKELELQGVFVAIGHIILSDLAKSIGVKTNEKGEIILDHKTSETNIKGVFGAGDVTDKPFKQLITGVADGCTAAFSAYEYISKNIK